MQLTRMHLNPHRRGTRHLVASAQRLHAAVLSGFPPGVRTETDAGRVLWRLDSNRQGALTLYVSSPGRPDLTHLVEQAGWPTAPDPWQTTSLDPLLQRLEPAQRWTFRLTANPVRSKSNGEGKRGTRSAHVTVDQQEQWLAERCASWGFSLGNEGALTAAVSSRRTTSFLRRSDREQHRVTLGVATFDGTLTVTDPDVLRASLCHGLGRAKGYGCGLMTLAPLS